MRVLSTVFFVWIVCRLAFVVGFCFDLSHNMSLCQLFFDLSCNNTQHNIQQHRTFSMTIEQLDWIYNLSNGEKKIIGWAVSDFRFCSPFSIQREVIDSLRRKMVIFTYSSCMCVFIVCCSYICIITARIGGSSFNYSSITPKDSVLLIMLPTLSDIFVYRSLISYRW